jgi:hypothetical protein
MTWKAAYKRGPRPVASTGPNESNTAAGGAKPGHCLESGNGTVNAADPQTREDGNPTPPHRCLQSEAHVSNTVKCYGVPSSLIAHHIVINGVIRWC